MMWRKKKPEKKKPIHSAQSVQQEEFSEERDQKNNKTNVGERDEDRSEKKRVHQSLFKKL